MRQMPREQWPPEAHAPPSRWPTWERVCMVAFYDLSTCRARSLTSEGAQLVGPIPWTAIAQWAQAHQIRGADLDVFTAAIRAMDAAWLPLEIERIKQEARRG